MAKFDPEHATVPNTNFSDRNSAERFLECGKFKRCANLLLPLVHQASPPVNVYVPICAESRFITYVRGDREVRQYAMNFRNVLTKAGWNVRMAEVDERRMVSISKP
jgi:hypothetical protein